MTLISSFLALKSLHFLLPLGLFGFGRVGEVRLQHAHNFFSLLNTTLYHAPEQVQQNTVLPISQHNEPQHVQKLNDTGRDASVNRKPLYVSTALGLIYCTLSKLSWISNVSDLKKNIVFSTRNSYRNWKNGGLAVQNKTLDLFVLQKVSSNLLQKF